MLYGTFYNFRFILGGIIMRIDHDIGIYTEHYAMIIKWYNLAFRGKEPSNKDKDTFALFTLIYNDMIREDKEDKEVE